MNKTTAVAALACLLFCRPALAQKGQNGEERLNDGVKSRVREVTLITGMSSDKQERLSRYFLKKDSLIMAEVRAENNPQKLATLLSGLDREFETLLSPAERARYFLYRNDAYNQREAKEMALYLAKRYDTRTEIQQWIYNIELEKDMSLSKAFGIGINESTANLIQTIMYRYDSLLNIYKVAARGEHYLQAKLKSIDSVKMLEVGKRKAIADQFMNLCLTKGDDYHMNFHTALQLVLTDKSYFPLLYKDSIEHIARGKTQADLKELSYKYSLADSLLEKIAPIALGKNQKQAVIEASYAYGRVRDSLQKENNETYWAAVKQILIRNGHYRLGNSRFVYAMAHKKTLGLTALQLDSLAYRNYQLDLQTYQYSLVDPWTQYDGSNFVKFQFERILRPGQYDTLLRLDSRPGAVINARKDWQAIRKFGLTPASDSISVFNELFGYHLACATIDRRYAGNDALQIRLLRQAREAKPVILRKLEAAIKMKEYESSAAR